MIRATLHRLKSQLCISQLRHNSWPDDSTNMNFMTCFFKLFFRACFKYTGSLSVRVDRNKCNPFSKDGFL